MNDHLKTARTLSNNDGSPVTESYLIANNDSLRDVWMEIQNLKRSIADEKHQASKTIDEKYKEQLEELTSKYAMLITFMR